MKKKKIIAIVLATVLVAAGLGSFAHANPDPVNDVLAHFKTIWKYTSPGDNFTNSEVTGSRQWGTHIQNRLYTTKETLTNANLSLVSDLKFDFVYPVPEIMGPPTYNWSFGDVPQGSGAGADAWFTSTPNPFPVTFTPGFDASRSVDKTVFLKSEGTQPQTLTITVTPRDEEMDTIGMNVHAKEEDWVNPVITSCRLEDITKNTDTIVNGGEFMSDLSLDGHFLGMWQNDPVVDAKYTYVVTIEVTPTADKVDFLPFVSVLNLPKHPITPRDTGPSVEHFVDGMGKWTWSIDGSYPWAVAAGEPFRSVTWRHYSREIPVIEDFTIKEMVIDFDRRPNEDEIAIKKATFRLQEGTYALSVDDVTVIVDGVVITIPAGSFVQGKGGDYIFKSPKGVEPKLDMKLNFDKGEWHFKVDKIDASIVDNCDGVDVTLFIGPMGASERVDMSVDRLLYTAGF